MTRNDELNRRMVSYDELTKDFADLSKAAIFSDGGAGVEAMVEQLDEGIPSEEPTGRDGPRRLSPEDRKRKVDAARKRLERAGLGHLVPVMNLIVRNGSNRRESIWQMMR